MVVECCGVRRHYVERMKCIIISGLLWCFGVCSLLTAIKLCEAASTTTPRTPKSIGKTKNSKLFCFVLFFFHWISALHLKSIVVNDSVFVSASSVWMSEWLVSAFFQFHQFTLSVCSSKCWFLLCTALEQPSDAPRIVYAWICGPG